MFFRNFKTTGMAIAASVVMAACGGGGDTSSGGTSSGLLSMTVNATAKTLTAGRSTELSAHALMRGAKPSTMTWTASALSAVNAGDPPPILSDAGCATASYAAPAVANASGEGSCRTIVTAPYNAASGRWRFTNTAGSATAGSVSNFVDVDIVAIPASGFKLLESSVPLTGYANKPLGLNMPFTINPGATVTDVSYQWAAASQNPAVIAIAGSRNSQATVIPIISGQYRFDVEVTAKVNGFTEKLLGSVVANVYPPTVTDIISAGDSQTAATGSIVRLTGAIQNRDNTLTYTSAWTQVEGALGGPVRVKINNANASTADFVAPTTPGEYSFQYEVTKQLPDGTTAVTKAETTVIVQMISTGVFNVTAGDIQTVANNNVVLLKGNVATSGASFGVSYSYKWTQVGTTPATVAIANGNTTSASFFAATVGTYTFDLEVTATSTTGRSTVTARTQVIVSSTGGTGTGSSGGFALSATAGPAQSVGPNAVVTLTGNKTTQGTTSGMTLAYAWTQVSPATPTVTLSNANTETATFIPTASGVYVFRFTVTATLADGSTRTAASDTQVVVGGVGTTFSVSAGNAQVIGANQAATMSGVVTQQGSFAGATFSYVWTQVGTTPATVTVANANALSASFVAVTPGTYTFELTVTCVQGGTTTVSKAQTQVLVTP